MPDEEHTVENVRLIGVGDGLGAERIAVGDGDLCGGNFGLERESGKPLEGLQRRCAGEERR